jgi:MFS family permease
VSTLKIIRETFVNRNLAVLTLTQTLYMSAVMLWIPYRSLYILELGATKELLGMLLMVETLSQLIFQLPGGILTDRLGRKKVIVISSIFRVATPIVYLMGTHWTHLAPGLILSSAGMISLPAVNALIAESLPPQRRSSGFAAYRTVTWMPIIFTSLLGGVFMDYYGVLKGARICLQAMLIISIATNSEYLRSLGKMPRNVWVLTGVAALSGFAMRSVYSFMVIYAVEEVGLTTTQWGLIGTIVNIIATALTLPGGILADRIGRKPSIIASKLLAPIATIGFTLSNNFNQLAMTQVIGAGVSRGFGGTVWGNIGGPVWQAVVADCTPPEERGRMMGLMGSIINIANIPASWVGGYLYDNSSPALPFQLSFAVDVISLILFIALFKEPERNVTMTDGNQESPTIPDNQPT